MSVKLKINFARILMIFFCFLLNELAPIISIEFSAINSLLKILCRKPYKFLFNLFFIQYDKNIIYLKIEEFCKALFWRIIEELKTFFITFNLFFIESCFYGVPLLYGVKNEPFLYRGICRVFFIINFYCNEW